MPKRQQVLVGEEKVNLNQVKVKEVILLALLVVVVGEEKVNLNQVKVKEVILLALLVVVVGEEKVNLNQVKVQEPILVVLEILLLELLLRVCLKVRMFPTVVLGLEG
jgi:hypothetical protein